LPSTTAFNLNINSKISIDTFVFEGSIRGLDSVNVERVGYWPFGPPRSVLAIEGYVFVGYGGGIWIFDVSDPSNPVKVGEI